MQDSKPAYNHFSIVKFTVRPNVSAKLPMQGFNMNKAAEVFEHPGFGTKLPNVARPIAKACEAMTMHTDLEALKELVLICSKKDTQSKINWGNTLFLIRQRMIQLSYPFESINAYIRDLAQTGLEPASVFK